jgi:archaellum biogenesis ATPase FlaH
MVEGVCPGGASMKIESLKSIPPAKVSEKIIKSMKGIPDAIKEKILKMEPIGARSESSWGVLCSLIEHGYHENIIYYVFDNYPVGEKAREQGRRWLDSEIQRARTQTSKNQINQRLSDEKKCSSSAIRGLSFSSLIKLYSDDVKWIYRNHIPKGQPCMINGREGVGKTGFSLKIVKEILEQYTQNIIVWLATEGAVKNTTDQMQGIGLVSDRFLIAQKNDGSFIFNFGNQADLTALDQFLKSLPLPVVAVFIDSLRGCTQLDDNDSKIGKIMHRVNSIVCDKYGAALIYLHHFNKNKDASLLDRCTGTTAAAAAVRHILSVLPKSKFTRLIKVSKSNINDMVPDLECIKAGKKLIIHEPQKLTEESLSDKCEEFLTKAFFENPVIPAYKIYQDGADLGYSDSMLKALKLKLGIESYREAKGWVWSWPAMQVLKSANSSNSSNDVEITILKSLKFKSQNQELVKS